MGDMPTGAGGGEFPLSARAVYPLDCDLVDDGGHRVLPIFDDEYLPHVILRLTNQSEESIEMQSLGTKEPHVTLEFRCGVLSARSRSALHKDEAAHDVPPIAAEDGKSTVFPVEPRDSAVDAVVGVQLPRGTVLAAGDTIEIPISGLGADPKGGPRMTRVRIRHAGLTYPKDDAPLVGQRVVTMQLLTLAAPKEKPMFEPPLHAWLRADMDTLTINEDNEIELYLANIHEDQSFRRPEDSLAAPTVTLSFEATTAVCGWGLAPPDRLRTFTVEASFPGQKGWVEVPMEQQVPATAAPRWTIVVPPRGLEYGEVAAIRIRMPKPIDYGPATPLTLEFSNFSGYRNSKVELLLPRVQLSEKKMLDTVNLLDKTSADIEALDKQVAALTTRLDDVPRYLEDGVRPQLNQMQEQIRRLSYIPEPPLHAWQYPSYAELSQSEEVNELRVYLSNTHKDRIGQHDKHAPTPTITISFVATDDICRWGLTRIDDLRKAGVKIRWPGENDWKGASLHEPEGEAPLRWSFSLPPLGVRSGDLVEVRIQIKEFIDLGPPTPLKLEFANFPGYADTSVELPQYRVLTLQRRIQETVKHVERLPRAVQFYFGRTTVPISKTERKQQIEVVPGSFPYALILPLFDSRKTSTVRFFGKLRFVYSLIRWSYHGEYLEVMDPAGKYYFPDVGDAMLRFEGGSFPLGFGIIPDGTLRLTARADNGRSEEMEVIVKNNGLFFSIPRWTDEVAKKYRERGLFNRDWVLFKSEAYAGEFTVDLEEGEFIRAPKTPES